jgi:CRP/FNR family transcriptional regulator, cyclic AMP receptor protein
VERPAFAGGVDLLELLSPEQQGRLLDHSHTVQYRAGVMPFGPGGPGRALLVKRGLARIYLSAPDGRQATVAFGRPGNLIGARNLIPIVPLLEEAPLTSVQAVVDSTFTLLDLETVRNLAATDIDVVSAIATHLAQRVHYDLRVIAVRTLGTVLERLAFDLLNRACQSQLDVGRLESRATQEELAYSIGASREAVSRTLKELRDAGIVETGTGVTRLLDPVRLERVVQAFLQ